MSRRNGAPRQAVTPAITLRQLLRVVEAAYELAPSPRAAQAVENAKAELAAVTQLRLVPNDDEQP